MELKLQISDFAKEVFEREQLDPEAYVCELAEREAKRLWHIQRCRPKPKEEVKPVGRPRTSVIQKKVAELGDTLREIYLKQKEFYGTEFEQYFGEQERTLEEAIKNLDLDTLVWFQQKQPWVKRKKKEQEKRIQAPTGGFVA